MIDLTKKMLESSNIFEIQRMIDAAILDGWKLKKMGCAQITTPDAYFCALMVKDGD